MEDHLLSEARERQEAELSLISAAYNSDEVWFEKVKSNVERSSTVIHRVLSLRYDVQLVLSITLPAFYPLKRENENSTALINGNINVCRRKDEDSLRNDEFDDSCHRRYDKHTIVKYAYRQLPDLMALLRSIAANANEEQSEVVFVLFSQIQEWMESRWHDLLKNLMNDTTKGKPDIIDTQTIPDTPKVLGRRLIYSHHIIASSKRKGIIRLANDLSLGGYSKYGWPGIVVIEGAESSCIAFIDEIRKMRWQYLTVRGEQQIEIPIGSSLDEFRGFGMNGFEELGDDMSLMAEKCRVAGCEELFKTCMKVYSDENKNNNEDKSSKNLKIHAKSGVLILVDHMNDVRGYQNCLKSIVNQTKGFLFICDTKNFGSIPSDFVVVILGSNETIKRALKMWRISKVDVDKHGRPCVERMMKIITKDEMEVSSDKLLMIKNLYEKINSCDLVYDSYDAFNQFIICIGGEKWLNELRTTNSIK